MVIDMLVPPEAQKILGAAKGRDLPGFVITIEAQGASSSPARFTFDSDGAANASLVFVAHSRVPMADHAVHASVGAEAPRKATLGIIRRVREAHEKLAASLLRAARVCKHVESAAIRNRSAEAHLESVRRLDILTGQIEAAWPTAKVSP